MICRRSAWAWQQRTEIHPVEKPVNDLPPPDGLASTGEVEALADQLSASADALHKRIIKAVKAQKGPFSDEQQALLRSLSDDEQLLRQHANRLYADAATAVVPSLGVPQQHIMALTSAAVEKIRKIAELGELVGLVGGLLSLAGAAAAGKLSGVVDALEQVRTHLAGVRAHRPTVPPASP